MTIPDARHAAEIAARVSYGRILAILAARSRDIAGAEDALAEAFVSALRVWPERGIPANPDGWLLTAARNSIRNAIRHRKTGDAAMAEIGRDREQSLAAADPDFPDERLKLLFVCAHPAIDASVRTPLMLQAVLGLDAARIAAAFLIAPAAMGQRLVRAKTKIRDARIRFAVPEPEQMASRLADVLDAVYVAYGAGWDGVAGADNGVRGLAEEAIYLGRLLASLLPDEPEALGLLALMLYCEARRAARRNDAGVFVPLKRQDWRLWSRDLIIEAEGLLTRASRNASFGRFQCEASIQSVHVQRPLTGHTNHRALETLYDLLIAHAPTIGAKVARAAVTLESGDAEAALGQIERLPLDRVAAYQPYFVVKAHILRALGRNEEASSTLATAIALSTAPEIRDALVAAFADVPD